MYAIRNHVGKKHGEPSTTIIIKKQNTPEQTFTFTWGNISTAEAANAIDKVTNLFESKINKSAVLEMLYAIKFLSNENQVQRLIKDLMNRVKK